MVTLQISNDLLDNSLANHITTLGTFVLDLAYCEVFGPKYIFFHTDATKVSEDFPIIRSMAEKGQLKVLIDSVLPLDDVKAAWSKSQLGQAKGKIILRIA